MTVITVLPSIVSPGDTLAAGPGDTLAAGPGDTLAAGQAAQNLNVMAGPPKHWGLA
jgi:hypothetical protein